MTNSIGPFNFISMGPAPELYRRALILMERPGVNNHVILRAGMKGRPFNLQTQVDALDLYDGTLAYANYQSYIATNPVPVVYADVAFTTFNVLYLVLDVKADVRAIQGAVGGLFPPSLAWVTADWTLLPIGYA